MRGGGAAQLTAAGGLGGGETQQRVVTSDSGNDKSVKTTFPSPNDGLQQMLFGLMIVLGAFATLIVFFVACRLVTGTVVGTAPSGASQQTFTATVPAAAKQYRGEENGDSERTQRRVSRRVGTSQTQLDRVERRRRRREGRVLLQYDGDADSSKYLMWRKGSDAWRVEPSKCPGTPSKLPLTRGAPRNKAVREKVEEMLLEQAEGKLRAAVRPGSSNVTGSYSFVDASKGNCVFLTQECADPNYGYGRRMAVKMAEAGAKGYGRDAAGLAKWDQKRKALINLGPGSLGSCALVANSENMMRSKRGADIDAHDTVFRHNTPLRGYEEYVGRRSTVIWNKSTYQAKPGQGVPELAHALLMNLDKVPPSLKYRSKHIFLRAGAANPLARDRRAMYRINGAGRRKHPSGGFSRPLNILASGLCTRVDLYGFSGQGGGKYFSKASKVRAAHDMPFEHWSFRFLMSKGKLCVYGD
ncbi:glycosyltransferase family 29 [Pseudoscourfieldia marina]